MKTRILAVTALVFLFAGCARFAPNMISPDVYSSSRDAIVEEDKANKEQFSSKIMSEKDSRARAGARRACRRKATLVKNRRQLTRQWLSIVDFLSTSV